MPSEVKVLKGYVKTESMILLLIVALALGFVGGVVFSAYRLGSGTSAPGSPEAKLPVTPQQKEMIASLIRQTETNPKDVNAWTQLGHLYFDTDQPAKAIDAYEKSLALEPDRPDVWTDLGVMYRRNGDPQKAIQIFDHALSIKPDHQIALFNKGVVLMHDLNDPKGALDAWEKLLAINPDARTPGGQSLKTMVEQLKKNGVS
jgi:cytochrome c-type biogenesis protein CcmH/NrfG